MSMLVDGPRGFGTGVSADTEDEDEDISQFGIDWEGMEDPQLLEHHRLNNPDEDHNNIYSTAPPEQLSHVPCEPPNSPLTQMQIARLDGELRRVVNTESKSMVVRRQVWTHALRLCERLVQEDIDGSDSE